MKIHLGYRRLCNACLKSGLKESHLRSEKVLMHTHHPIASIKDLESTNGDYSIHWAANKARYTPHPIPTKLPTMVFFSTGMNRCCIRLTAGQSL